MNRKSEFVAVLPMVVLLFAFASHLMGQATQGSILGTVTDSAGTYFTQTLAAGTYRAKTTAPAYVDKLFNNISCALGCLPARPLTLELLDLAVTPGGQITASVDHIILSCT